MKGSNEVRHMCLEKKRKGQSSVEFVLIAGVMFLVFLGMFMVIQSRMASTYKDKIYTTLDGFGNLLNTEVRLANTANGDYSRIFYLPWQIEGYNYTVTLKNQQDITVRVEDVDYAIFLDENVSGSISKGENIIQKISGNISINSGICALGYLNEEDCGIIDCSGWYVTSGNSCYNKQDITTNRCKGAGECKESNSTDCNSQSNDVPQYSCSECKYIAPQDCNGINLGACSNSTLGTPCSGGKVCDGYGHCNMISGATAFIIKNNAGQNVSKFDEAGNIFLRGTCSCSPSANCAAPPANSFVLKNSAGDVVAYIDLSGNLCIKGADCNDNDANCNNPGTNSFVLKDSTGKVVMYINELGNLCLIGSLTPNGNP